VPIANDTGTIAIDSVTVLLWAGLDESATATVNDAVPTAVGVPEIRPVDVFRLSPAGRLPERNDQVYGAVPPLGCSAIEYAEPTVPEGKDDEPIVKPVGPDGVVITGRETVVVADCTNELESVTLISKE